MEPMLQTVDLHSHLVVEQNEPQEITSVVDKCKIQAYILEKRQDTTIIVDVCSRPFQKELIGKKVGDTFLLLNGKLTYRIDKILIDG